jgi:prepilin signal peptidase PulO-like enzyme (type II secretory pathway)
MAIVLAVMISLADLRRRIIPDAYLFPLMLIGLTLVTFYNFPTDISNATIGATFGYIMATIIGVLFDRLHKNKNTPYPPIGMGDIKLLSTGGLWLGTSGLAVALIISCITGSIWAHKHKQQFIPFAPFFIFGGFLSFIINLFLI